MSSKGGWPLKNWIPYKLDTVDSVLRCHWLNTYGEPFTEPFFDETILKCRSTHSAHFNFSSVSNLQTMTDWSQNLNEVIPNTIIFHISRCGSTLVSQLLATMEANNVLAEVPFLDDILRLPYQSPDFNEAVTSKLFVSALKYYGQKKNEKEKQLFIKADSWHIFFYKQLRHLYPSVPFVFIFRSPDEVFRSLCKIPALQSVPGLIESSIFGFEPDEFIDNHQLYLPAVLESYLRQYLKIIETDTKCLLLNYNEGPIEMIKKIASFAYVALTDEDLVIIEKRSHYHSKRPGEFFTEETTEPVPQYLEKAMEFYQVLEDKRKLINQS